MKTIKTFYENIRFCSIENSVKINDFYKHTVTAIDFYFGICNIKY